MSSSRSAAGANHPPRVPSAAAVERTSADLKAGTRARDVSAGGLSGATQAGGWRRPTRPPAPRGIPMTGSLSAQPSWDPTLSFPALPGFSKCPQPSCGAITLPHTRLHRVQPHAGELGFEYGNSATQKLQTGTRSEGRDRPGRR